MQFRILPLGFAAFACFANTLAANPRAPRSCHDTSSAAPVLERDAVPRSPQLLVPFINVPTTKASTLNKTDFFALEKRGAFGGNRRRPPVPGQPDSSFFDNRPSSYTNRPLDFTYATNTTQRMENLQELWKAAEQYNDLDGGNYYGKEKWFLLQAFSVGVLPEHNDNHEDIKFIARLFKTTPESIRWFSHQMAVSQSLRGDEHWPEYALYEPHDHFNWIRKAHGTLGKMTKEEQRTVNYRIDNAAKLAPGDLIRLYEAFEVSEGMPEEHRLQAAEFFQVTDISFPIAGIGNVGKSTRGPVHILDWNDKKHPRHNNPRPVDALARYAIPATDSDHSDWVTLTSIKIAHLPIEQQRVWRDRVRELTSSYNPTPRDLKMFYDLFNIDWRGKDDDALKAEIARQLCIRELVFSEMPRRKGLSHKESWSRVPQQPAMVNACTKEELDARLKELFFIERWDADHPDPLNRHVKSVIETPAEEAIENPDNTNRKTANSAIELPSNATATEITTDETPINSTIASRDVNSVSQANTLGSRIDHHLQTLKNILKPGSKKVEEKLKEWEMQLDQDLTRYRGNADKIKEKLKPIMKDFKSLGGDALSKIADILAMG